MMFGPLSLLSPNTDDDSSCFYSSMPEEKMP